MLTIKELENYLKQRSAHFEIIKHDVPIVTTKDAEQYFDISIAALSLVVQSNDELILLIVSVQRGKLDFKVLSQKLELPKLKLADRIKAEQITGYKIGSMPLIGLELPCIFDNQLLNFTYVYGGSGDAFYTLKIDPRDVKRLNNIRYTFE